MTDKGESMKKGWYLKIKFKDFYDGRKIWYWNNCYPCDCVNLPFDSREECESWIPELKSRYGNRIESITSHWTRR